MAVVRDLVTLTFDLEQLSYIAGRVVNPATKYIGELGSIR